MKANDNLKQRDTVLIKLKDEIESEYLMQSSYNFTNLEEKLFTNILAWFYE